MTPSPNASAPTKGAQWSQWIEVSADRLPTVGQAWQVEREAVARDRKTGEPVGTYAVGLAVGRVAEIGAQWSDSIHGRSGYYVRIEGGAS